MHAKTLAAGRLFQKSRRCTIDSRWRSTAACPGRDTARPRESPPSQAALLPHGRTDMGETNVCILVPVDFSNATPAVVEQAAALAAPLKAKVWLIHVAAPRADLVVNEFATPPDRKVVAAELRRAHQALQRHQDELTARGLDATAMLVRGGLPSDKILDEARRLQPAYIVLGSHGHGALYHLLTGSVCARVLKHSPFPVVVVPSRGKTKGS